MSELLAQADEHRINGRYDQARQLYEQIVAQQPRNATVWWGLAHTVMNQGEFELAEEHFGRAVELACENQRFIYDLAMLHTMLGDYEKARPLFERVRALDPASEEGNAAQKQLSYY